jgi:hypothetical protein
MCNKKQQLFHLADEAGFLDGVLRSHLEAVTKAFNSKGWKQQQTKIAKDKDANPALQRSQLNLKAEKIREQGNALFKAHDFAQARLLYTQSIAAAIEGPLCSLAFSNRFVVFLHGNCVSISDS